VTIVLVGSLSITDDALSVELSDGRSISAPLSWHPRLLHATAPERNRWQLIGKGEGIHWGSVDEDVSVESVLPGCPRRRRPALPQSPGGRS
jgi:hypothetical protein